MDHGQRVVCVLGMHRSGTSCLAGSLEEAGLALGENVITEAPHNRKGNRENPRIMALHEDLLASNGGSWHTPPPTVRWLPEHLEERDRIIASYRGYPVWGFKDPRSVLFLDGWRQALPEMRFAGTFRHPLAVATSLNSRNGFTLERGIELWTHHNRLLVRYQAELGFDMVSFDRPPADYLARLSTIARRLDLVPPAEGFGFFEPSLRSAPASQEHPLPSEAEAIYELLLALDAERTRVAK